MGRHERRAYLRAIRQRYSKGSREEKGWILDEFCAVCNYHRKYAIRILQREPCETRRRPGRRSHYRETAFVDILKRIWFATDQLCSKRFKAALPLWIPFYEQSYGTLDPTIHQALLTISAATIDRVLKPVRRYFKKGLCGTKPGRLLKNKIPIRVNYWDITKPGFMEADTVAHCGNSLDGDFAWSLVMTDILTGWTECRTVWNKAAHGVIEQTRDIESRLPFQLRGFHCDNGSEFLNYHLLRYFAHRPNKVEFTRGRPYRKNDNPHVEQKNWTHPRHLFGYDRIDNHELIPLMNNLYAQEWSLLQNHFYPSVKLVSKTRINSKYQKIYDKPKTPYHRVIECKAITKETKDALKIHHQSLNPFLLKKTIEEKLKRVFETVTVTSNVRHRL